MFGAAAAQAATSVGLGTADSYVVLGGQSVTNTGLSVLNADLGVSPGTSITGFPPGEVVEGSATHQTDAHALQAQIDLVTAYNSAAAQAPDETVSENLGGRTLLAGTYFSGSTMGLTGTVTLDGAGDPGAVWVFQVGSDLTTATGSSVALTNGAQACNVFWQVGASATLGTNSSFVGTVMALTSITVTSGTTVEGRALARNGSVTLDNNVFTDSRCGIDDGDGDGDGDGGDGDGGDGDGDGDGGTGTPGTPGTGTPGTPGTGTPGTPGAGTPGAETPGAPGTPVTGVPAAVAPAAVPFLPRTSALRSNATADVLAATGQADKSEWMLVPAALLLTLGSGVVLAARRRRA
jgi:hypothetical protein